MDVGNPCAFVFFATLREIFPQIADQIHRRCPDINGNS